MTLCALLPSLGSSASGVYGARRGTLSQREKVTGRAFDRQIGSTKRGDHYADRRIRTGFAFDRSIRYATGDCEWSSGESRSRGYSMRHDLTIDKRRLDLSWTYETLY